VDRVLHCRVRTADRVVVRSYRYNVQFLYRANTSETGFVSFEGQAYFGQFKMPPPVPGEELGWSSSSHDVSEVPRRDPSVPPTASVWKANRKEVYMPYWSITLILFGVGAAPWIRWSKRFSLRTLLIATTLVAVVLGLVVYVARH
jgi:hypothetical protein